MCNSVSWGTKSRLRVNNRETELGVGCIEFQSFSNLPVLNSSLKREIEHDIAESKQNPRLGYLLFFISYYGPGVQSLSILKYLWVVVA